MLYRELQLYYNSFIGIRIIIFFVLRSPFNQQDYADVKQHGIIK